MVYTKLANGAIGDLEIKTCLEEITIGFISGILETRGKGVSNASPTNCHLTIKISADVTSSPLTPTPSNKIMWAKYPATKFLGTVLKLKKRKNNLMSCARVLHLEIGHFKFSFCTGQQRNVPKAIVFANLTYCFVAFSPPGPSSSP